MRVLYICTDWYRVEGSSASLMEMLRGLGGSVSPCVLLPAEGEVARLLRGMGVRVLAVPFATLIDPRKPLLTALHHPGRTLLYAHAVRNRHCVNEVARLLADARIGLVHTNTSATDIGAAIARRLGVPHVWHVREFLDLDFAVRPLFGFGRLRHLLAGADARICVSDAVRQHWALPVENTYTIWDACGAAAPSGPSDKDPRMILFAAASLSEQKGTADAIDAFAASGLAAEGYRLTLLGHADGPTATRLAARAEGAGIAGAVAFEGYVADDTPYFRRASVFLMASRHEALGRVTIRAMQQGCLVVARRSGANPELLADGRGLLFNTVAECAASLREAAHNPHAATRLRATAFARAAFDPDAYAARVADIYQTLTAQCPR